MDEILRYFPDLSERQIDQFRRLESLYASWNNRINLISRKDIDSLYVKHILHSLAIAKFIQFTSGTKILDVGTGGGFPGIPLSIMFPESSLLLIDSIGKKITAVNGIISDLELKNCEAKQARAEIVKEKFDFIVSRAVTQFPKFYSWVRQNVNKKSSHAIKNGIIYLKGGDLTEELQKFKGKYTEMLISESFNDPFFETKKIIHLPLS